MKPGKASGVLVVDIKVKFLYQKSDEFCIIAKLANLNQRIFAGVVFLNQLFEICEIV